MTDNDNPEQEMLHPVIFIRSKKKDSGYIPLLLPAENRYSKVPGVLMPPATGGTIWLR